MKTEVFPAYVRACDQVIGLEARAMIMGVLNVTPDSFYDGGDYLDPQKAVDRVDRMIDEGADIIDIGGESTRPGSQLVDESEEMRRLEPVLKAVGRRSSIPISIDTRKSSVARMALDLGAVIVNDISALRHDSQMAPLIAERQAGVVLMHMQGTPETMQNSPVYEDVVQDVKQFFESRLIFAKEHGITSDQIILDPGIGFGKTVLHNLRLVSHCVELLTLKRPIMVGVSNKTFIGKITGRPIEDRLVGTAVASAIAIYRGAQIIRVHDVAGMYDVARIAVALRDADKFFQQN